MSEQYREQQKNENTSAESHESSAWLCPLDREPLSGADLYLDPETKLLYHHKCAHEMGLTGSTPIKKPQTVQNIKNLDAILDENPTMQDHKEKNHKEKMAECVKELKKDECYKELDTLYLEVNKPKTSFGGLADLLARTFLPSMEIVIGVKRMAAFNDADYTLNLDPEKCAGSEWLGLTTFLATVMDCYAGLALFNYESSVTFTVPIAALFAKAVFAYCNDKITQNTLRHVYEYNKRPLPNKESKD